MIFPSLKFCMNSWIKHRYEDVISNADLHNIINKIYINKFTSKSRRMKFIGCFLTAKSYFDLELDSYKEWIEILYENHLLHRFLRLSYLVKDWYNNDRLIERSAKLYLDFSSDEKDLLKSNLFNINNTIAIVGNAPISKENRNEGMGDVIDSADIVIRFNNFGTKQFEKDIGSKTDIHACITNLQWGGIKCNNILLTDDPIHHCCGDDFFNKVNSNAKCFQFSREMQEKFALDFTYELSSGFKVIWYLYKNGYKNLKIYGFSFLNKNCSPDRFDHYFEKVKKKEKLHNINEEILLLRKIMNSIE